MAGAGREKKKKRKRKHIYKTLAGWRVARDSVEWNVSTLRRNSWIHVSIAVL